jgi:hypothetical protein
VENPIFCTPENSRLEICESLRAGFRIICPKKIFSGHFCPKKIFLHWKKGKLIRKGSRDKMKEKQKVEKWNLSYEFV